MKLPAAESATFRAVASHYGLDAGEIELAREAYRRDPEAGRALYQSLYRYEVSDLWRHEMSAALTERFKRVKAQLLAKAGLDATGPGQPEKPLRPPVEQREQPEPVWEDPPKEAA